MCSITETHFDCDEKHGPLMRTFKLPAAYPLPEDLTFIESIIWNFGPPWYEAFADGVKLPKSVTASAQLIVDNRDYTGRSIGFGNFPSDECPMYVSSNLYHRGRNYNRERTKGRSRFEFFVFAVPKEVSKPFSSDEIAWLQEPPSSEPTGGLPQTPPKWLSSTLSALTHCARTKVFVQPIDRFVHSEIYDKNVWRIILSFAIPPSRANQRLLQIGTESLGNLVQRYVTIDDPVESCITADGRFFAQVWRESDTMKITINGMRAFSFIYPSDVTSELIFAVSESYIAILMDEITFLIVSHTGAHVAHFTLTFAVPLCIAAFTLHPTLPLVIVGTDSNVIILDFKGNIFGRLPGDDLDIWPQQIIFDSVNELVIAISRQNGVAFPLDNAPAFTFKLVLADNAPVGAEALHFLPDTKTQVTLHWSK